MFPATVGSLLTAGALCLALATGTAHAADGSDDGTVQRAVPSADLNLSRPADQQVLRHRLRAAAMKLCMSVTPDKPLDSDVVVSCYEAAARDALHTADEMIAAAQSSSQVAAARDGARQR